MATENKCPHCGKPVPPTALPGICPECMLKAGLAADTGEVGPGGTVVAKPTQPAPGLAEIAPHFPQLEILECLGRGGMGAVYKARQPKLDRFVALKILTRHREGGITDTEFAARFQQEARALARITHPDIVAVYDFGEAGGYHYLLMEYVDGLTLRQLLQTHKLSPEQALSIVPKICEALQFAHERGIVHRDIKPENILLDKQGRVKIADFGIAKIVGPEAAVGRGLTGAKDVIGTPHYMAPEQIEKPATVDHRADIYSLGVVFYEMLTGELPLGKFQPPSRMVQVDVRLDEVVLHALEKNPDRRYQHASEVKTDVETIATTPGGSTEPTKRATPSAGFPAIGRQSTCYFSTPERMRNCFPSAAAQIFVCKGELRLEPEALTFLTSWHTRVVVPLKDIEDLSIGQFQMWTTPWVMQYERLNYLSLTFTKDGRRQTIHLTPVPAGTTSAKQINEQIGGWFEAVQKAVIALTGATPRVSEPRAVSISAQPAWNRKGVPLFIAWLVAWGLVLWRLRPVFISAPEPLGVAVFVIQWLLLFALTWFGFGFLKANYAIKRGDLDVVTSNEPPENFLPGFSGPTTKPAQPPWVTAARWTARVLGTALLVFFGFFILNEGVPAIASQPAGIQLNFAVLALMLFGFVVGWKREGAAALLIASGWTLWQISENAVRWNLFQTPLPVAALYAFCWWATQGRRTRAVAVAVVTLAVVLGLGRLFWPTSVFIRGFVTDAETGKPIPNAELTGERSSGESSGENILPNARSDKDGRFQLYVGWYAEGKRLGIYAPGYATLETNLGPRALGDRDLSRDFQLQPVGNALGVVDEFAEAVPPVVVSTVPESGVSNVDPALTEIRVTFSKDMITNRMWAICQVSKDTFPETAGENHYLDDRRTCVMPVKLESGKTYALWFNVDQFDSFRDTHNHPSVPYLLIFETRK